MDVNTAGIPTSKAYRPTPTLSLGMYVHMHMNACMDVYMYMYFQPLVNDMNHYYKS